MIGPPWPPPFEAFPSIPRLKRTCMISEKIDGSNALVHISEDGSQIHAGSRNRWITPEDDNYGFARWVYEHREELLLLGPGNHYGEWWGSGIQRRYGLVKNEKRFSLFNAGRWLADPIFNQRSSDLPECCDVVPVLYSGEFSSTIVDEVLADLKLNGSRAAPYFMNPEGVVVYLTASRSLFKVTLDGDGHKGQKKA